MEKSTLKSAEGLASGSSAWRWWPWFFLGLLVWQGWMAWGLLGQWALFDDRPILSGYHPQHLYLGTLGAQSLRNTGRGCCYD